MCAMSPDGPAGPGLRDHYVTGNNEQREYATNLQVIGIHEDRPVLVNKFELNVSLEIQGRFLIRR